jgi:signal transduction histidine kinase
MTELKSCLDTLDNSLHTLGDLIENENSRYRMSDYRDFRDTFELVMEEYYVLREELHDDLNGNLSASNPDIVNTFNSLNLSFQEFRSLMPAYLLRDKREYQTEIVVVTLLNTLLVILAGYVILRLTKQLAEAERKLVTSTIEIENRERERIAADLHDGLGAILSGLMIHIQVLQKESGENYNLRMKLKHLGDMATEALSGLEETINNLNPSILSRHGLYGSLQRLVKRINDLNKTQFYLETEGMPEALDKGTELLLFRICSELINNTLKHSGAQRAVLRFEAVRRNLTLKYSDDGDGFVYDREMIEERKSGINNINQRVESMNGQCAIRTAPGEGIEVTITLPLARA